MRDAPQPARWPQQIGEAGRYITQTLRLMVGLPDYGTYLDHMEATHPGKPVMSYAEFFRDRQDARFGAKGPGRCC